VALWQPAPDHVRLVVALTDVAGGAWRGPVQTGEQAPEHRVDVRSENGKVRLVFQAPAEDVDTVTMALRSARHPATFCALTLYTTDHGITASSLSFSAVVTRRDTTMRVRGVVIGPGATTWTVRIGIKREGRTGTSSTNWAVLPVRTSDARGIAPYAQTLRAGRLRGSKIRAHANSLHSGISLWGSALRR
jgi:hypothetical protein